MAKSNVNVTPPPTQLDDEALEMADLNAAEGGDLFKAIDDIRGTAGVKIRIVRIVPNDGHCEDMDVAEWSLETLTKRWGAGTYKLRIVGPKGFLPGGGTLKIAPRPSDGKSGGSGEFMPFMEYLEKRESERRKEQSDKWGRIVEISIPVLGTVFTAIMSRGNGPDLTALITALKPPPAPTMQDITATLANLKALNAPPENSSSSIDSIVKIMEVVKDFSEGKETGPKESNWIDLLRDLAQSAPVALKPLIEAMQAQATIRAQAAQGVRPTVVATPPASAPQLKPASVPGPTGTASVQPAAPGTAPIAAASSGQSGDDMMMFIKPMISAKLKILLGWARANRDPIVYAQVFCDEHVPENIADFLPQEKVLEYLKNEKWFEFVCAEEPGFAEHKEWCEDFRTELIEIASITGEELPGENPPPDAA